MTTRRALGDVLPLHVFVRRRQVTGLYRNLLRAAGALVDPSVRVEVVGQIKQDFSRRKSATDVIVIKSFIQEGNNALKTINGMVTSVRSQPSPVAGSWLDKDDHDDPRGRVGEGWPWQS